MDKHIAYHSNTKNISLCGEKATLHSYSYDDSYNSYHVKMLLPVMNDNLRLLSFRIESEGWV